MARCCTAAVGMALHSGSAGNGDSHWSLQRKHMIYPEYGRGLDIRKEGQTGAPHL